MSAQEVTTSYDCREPNCTKEAKSKVGRYAYCDFHQQVRANLRLEEEAAVIVSVPVPQSSGSPFVRLGEVGRKIASLTSIIRTRSEDGTRVSVNGGPAGSLYRRQEDAVQRLEAVAAKLEATI